MGRKPKQGLHYFPVDVDIFSDGKIEELVGKYSSDGLAIYLAILCIVYRNGYYFEAESELGIVKAIQRELYDDRISRQRVLDVLHFCGVIRLLDSRLLCENVITSASIQSRYDEVTVRNKVDKSKYWLLSKNENEDRALESVPENAISVTEMPINVTEMQQNKRKENKNKINESKASFIPPALEDVKAYCAERKNGINAEQFCNYYGARGWKGIIDWKSQIRYWETNGINKAQTQAGTKAATSFDVDDAVSKALKKTYKEN